MPLAPVVEMIEKHENDDGEDVFLTQSVYNRDGHNVVVFVASIKEWCGEWRAYMMSFSAHWHSEEVRHRLTRTHGVKLTEEVAKVLFDGVEHRYGVKYAR